MILSKRLTIIQTSRSRAGSWCEQLLNFSVRVDLEEKNLFARKASFGLSKDVRKLFINSSSTFLVSLKNLQCPERVIFFLFLKNVKAADAAITRKVNKKVNIPLKLDLSSIFSVLFLFGTTIFLLIDENKLVNLGKGRWPLPPTSLKALEALKVFIDIFFRPVTRSLLIVRKFIICNKIQMHSLRDREAN